jgi:hypothetical protein
VSGIVSFLQPGENRSRIDGCPRRGKTPKKQEQRDPGALDAPGNSYSVAHVGHGFRQAHVPTSDIEWAWRVLATRPAHSVPRVGLTPAEVEALRL